MRIFMPAANQHREQRQATILKILREQRIDRQTVLVQMLRQHGFEATQSSVSRDLKQLGVTKLDSGYGQAEPTTADEHELTLFRDFVRDIRAAGPNLTVVQTAVGAAQRVAVYLDRSGWNEIVGTLSGDDTIFIATSSGTEQRRLVSKLKARIGH